MFEPKLPALRDKSPAPASPLLEGYAPFLSTVPRAPDGKLQKANLKLSPGPGSYEVSKPLVRPLIETLRKSNNNIIIKINEMGSAAFRDHTDRFGDGMRTSDMPGPGQYYTIDDSTTKQRQHQYPAIHNSMHRYRSKFKQMFNQERTETIPQQKVLRSTKKHVRLQEGLGDNLQQIRRSAELKGSVWSKYVEQRFRQILGESKSPGPGPGFYEHEQQQEKPLEMHPSPSFVSSSVRSYFDNLYYDTNQDAKARLRDQIKFKSDRPGPGQYELEVQQERRSNKFQFFGSTEERLLPGPHASPKPTHSRHRSLALRNLAARMLNEPSQPNGSSLNLSVLAGDSSLPTASIHAASSLQTIDFTANQGQSLPAKTQRTRKAKSVRDNHKPELKPVNMIFDKDNLF